MSLALSFWGIMRVSKANVSQSDGPILPIKERRKPLSL